jgi:hypothetical protein
MRPPLVALAGLAAALGLLPLLTTGPLAVEPAPAAWELIGSGLLAAAAVAVTWRRANRIAEPRLLRGWLGLELAARAVCVRPIRALAAALARFDDRVLDLAVDGAARGVGAAARALNRRGELSVDGMVRGIGVGARSLGRLARRPQTGQIHQYYAQAAAAFAVLALFLIVVR